MILIKQYKAIYTHEIFQPIATFSKSKEVCHVFSSRSFQSFNIQMHPYL